MEKVKYRYNRWRLALGRLVNLRYINRWIIFCADLWLSLKPWGIALKFLFLHHENILFPND